MGLGGGRESYIGGRREEGGLGWGRVRGKEG